jgi:uncharacterized protein YfdQ (DUF2303 family)
MTKPYTTGSTFEADDATIREIGELTVAATAVREVGDATLLVLPPGFQHHDITKAVQAAAPAPARPSGTVTLTDVASFIAYVKNHAAAPSSYIYADSDRRKLVAVLNDHCQGDLREAGWRDFRAEYSAELSREFQLWLAANAKPMEQEEFAIFIEDNIADVAEPTGETLLQIALTLQAKTEVNFGSARRLDNGQVQLHYSETIDARASAGNIEIPREFRLGVRVFKNGDAYGIRARLKYRLGAGKLRFWYELDRPDDIIEHAFEAYIDAARTSAGITVLRGSA